MAFQQIETDVSQGKEISIDSINLSELHESGGRTEWQPHLRGAGNMELAITQELRVVERQDGSKVDVCPKCESEDLLREGLTGELFCGKCGLVLDQDVPDGCGALPKLLDDEPVEGYNPEEGGITLRDGRRNRIWND